MIAAPLGTGGEDVDHLITYIENKMLVPSCAWRLQEEFKLEGEQMVGL